MSRRRPGRRACRRLDGAQALPTGAWPQQDWWTGLASAGLDQLITRALSPANPRLAEAVDTVQWAASISTWRAAALGPQLSGQAAVTPLQFSGNSPLGALGLGNKLYDSGDVGLGFTQALDFWGKYADRLKAALGEQRAAEARLADTRRLLAAAVVHAYLRWAEAEQQLASTRRLQHLYQQRQALLRTRRHLGLGTDLSIADLLCSSSRIPPAWPAGSNGRLPHASPWQSLRRLHRMPYRSGRWRPRPQ
jgi:Outer membrane protein